MQYAFAAFAQALNSVMRPPARKDSPWRVIGQSVAGARQGVQCPGETRSDLKCLNARVAAQTIDSVEYDANGSYRLGDIVTLPPRSGRQRTLIEEFFIGLDPLFFEWDPNGPQLSACTERAHAHGSYRGRGCGDPVAEAPTRAIVWPW